MAVFIVIFHTVQKIEKALEIVRVEAPQPSKANPLNHANR